MCCLTNAKQNHKTGGLRDYPKIILYEQVRLVLTDATTVCTFNKFGHVGAAHGLIQQPVIVFN